MEIKIIRSARKTLVLVATSAGIVVRAPKTVPMSKIQAFVDSHKTWIEKQSSRYIFPEEPVLSQADINDLLRKAKAYFPERLNHYANLLGVTYGKVSFRLQKTLWGSCTKSGNLSFNLLLLLTPDYVIDGIIAHELCHRKHMNHGQGFYTDLLRIEPRYKEAQAYLKKNGTRLMARNPNTN